MCSQLKSALLCYSAVTLSGTSKLLMGPPLLWSSPRGLLLGPGASAGEATYFKYQVDWGFNRTSPTKKMVHFEEEVVIILAAIRPIYF